MPQNPSLPVQNAEAEQSVLGAMLIEREAIIEAAAVLTEDAFYHETHRIIYRAMLDLFEDEGPVDLVTLTEHLTRTGRLAAVGGVAYLTTLTNATPTAANIPEYAAIVHDAHVARKVQQLCRDIPQRLAESPELAPVLEELQARVLELAQASNRGEARHLKDVLAERLAAYETKAEVGVKTGLYELDNLTSGLHKGELIIVAGRPSMGKSSLMRALCRRLAGKGTRCLIYSMEMSAEEQADALVAAEAKIDTSILRNRTFGDSGWKAIGNAYKVLPNLHIMLHDRADTSAEDIRAGARRLKMRYPDLGLIAVDYLQILRAVKAESRAVAVGAMSRVLKITARELKLPVLAVSQLSRGVESRDDKRPSLSDLRESGAIEQDADLVMLLYREDYYKPDTAKKRVTEVIIAKNRNGPTGTVELRWMPEYVTFENPTERGDDIPWP